jgi:UTP--glucose-1-phosphate uridylyltransferase
MTEEEWDRVIDVDLKGYFLCSQAVGKEMVKKKSGKIIHISSCSAKKPSPEEAPSNLAIAARYVFSPIIFHALEQTSFGVGNEIQLTDAIRLLIREGHKVYGVQLQPDEKRFDIGNFDSYFRAFLTFALTDEIYGENLRKHVGELLDANHS